MDCAHSDCLCTSEVGIDRDGRTYCSDYCASDRTKDKPCECGHAGCASVESGTSLG